MGETERSPERTTLRTHDEKWQYYVRDRGWFPERYVEGLERRMAEALWDGFLDKYPGLKESSEFGYRPVPLYLAAGGFLGHEDSWAVGESSRIIREARICADVARQAVGEELPETN